MDFYITQKFEVRTRITVFILIECRLKKFNFQAILVKVITCYNNANFN